MSITSILTKIATDVITRQGCSYVGVTTKGESLSGKLVFVSKEAMTKPGSYQGEYSRLAFATPTKIQPLPGDQITAGKETFTVVESSGQSPDNTGNIYWKLYLAL